MDSDRFAPSQPEQPARPSTPSVPETPCVPATPEKPCGARKIACIGKAPSSVLLAPYGDMQWEVWILNTLGSNNEVPRWDRQFEIHDLDLVKVPAYGGYYNWLASQENKIVYTRDEPPPEFKSGVQYPLAAVLTTFQKLRGGRYITNTVSMMLALALHEHLNGQPVSDIGLYGVDMAQQGLRSGNAGWFTSEYARQRPSCEYWIGVAEGLGITIHIPDQSDLLKTACIYGYQHTDAFKKFLTRQNELKARVADAQRREEAAHNEAVFLSGALEGGEYYEQWLTAENPGSNLPK